MKVLSKHSYPKYRTLLVVFVPFRAEDGNFSTHQKVVSLQQDTVLCLDMPYDLNALTHLLLALIIHHLLHH